MEKNLKPAPIPTRDSRGKTQDINNVSGHFGVRLRRMQFQSDSFIAETVTGQLTVIAPIHLRG